MIERPDPSDLPGALEPELRALLDDAKRRDTLDPAFGDAARERVLARVEGAVRAPPAVPGRGFGARSGLMLASACLLAIVAGTKLLSDDDARAPSSSAPALAAAPPHASTAFAPIPLAPIPLAPIPLAPTPATPPIVDRATPDVPSSAVGAVPSMHVSDLPSSASVPAAPPPARVVPRAAPSAPTGTRLAEEYRLVEDARAKLAAKDYAGASRSIREHDERFPAGQLNQECESLHIQMLVETGRVAEARERAQAFRARFPNGLLVPSVARAIASSGPSSNAP